MWLFTNTHMLGTAGLRGERVKLAFGGMWLFTNTHMLDTAGLRGEREGRSVMSSSL